MRYIFSLPFLLLMHFQITGQNIGIGTNTPDASAIVDMESTTQGLLVPRMTSAQRTAISSPAEGLLVFDITLGSFLFFQNSVWHNLSHPLLLSDQDGDTKVEVERIADQDKIHFSLGGFNLFTMDRIASGKGRIENFNSLNNLIIGNNSGEAITGGFSNTFIGDFTGRDNTNGDRNTFVGTSSGVLNTTGSRNTFIGFTAGNVNSTGIRNSFVGTSSGFSNTTGSYNNFVGMEAGTFNQTGNSNNYIGHRAGYSNNNGSNNVMIGDSAGWNVIGSGNVFIGKQAAVQGSNANLDNRLYINNTQGNDPLIYGEFDNDFLAVNGQLSVGTQTPGLYDFTIFDSDGDGDAFIQMFSESGDLNDIHIGFSDFHDHLFIRSMTDIPIDFQTNGQNTRMSVDNDVTTVFNQLSVGTVVPGSHELTVFDGDFDGDAIIRMFTTTGDMNDALIGFNETNDALLIRTVSNHDIKFQTNGSGTRMNIKNTGDVGIGTNSPTHKLHVTGVARSTQSTWATSSDRRVKKNIQDIESAISIIEKLRPVTFEWKDDYYCSQEGLDSFNYGFIAQEIEGVIPEAVNIERETVGNTEIEDFRTLNVGPILPILVKAVKEQQNEIQVLKQQNKQLMNKLEGLIDQISRKNSLTESSGHLDSN